MQGGIATLLYVQKSLTNSQIMSYDIIISTQKKTGGFYYGVRTHNRSKNIHVKL